VNPEEPVDPAGQRERKDDQEQQEFHSAMRRPVRLPARMVTDTIWIRNRPTRDSALPRRAR